MRQYLIWRNFVKSTIYLYAYISRKAMASSKASSKTILELTEAYDEENKKRYKKGKFLGKVVFFIYFIKLQ